MKLMHMADLHLGKNYWGALPYEISQRINQDIWKNLMDTVKLGCEKKIDLMLIAGDVYEREFFTGKDMARLMEIFKQADYPICIVAGNHDFIDQGSLYFRANFPSNVHLFSTEFSYIDFPDKQLRVFGKSYGRDYEKESLPAPQLHEEYKNILLLHGDTGDSPFLHVDKEMISPYDYVALGHIHKRRQVAKNCYYPGSPEPLSFKETGEHGVLLVDLDSGEVEFLKTAQKEFVQQSIHLYGKESYGEILTQVGEICCEDNNLYRITLSGRHRDHKFLQDTLEREVQTPYVEWEMQLSQFYSMEELKQIHAEDVVGEFIAQLEGSSHSCAKEALAIGLDYLLEGQDEA